MLTYVVRRILISILTVFFISFLIFSFLHLAPGDPLDAMMNPEAGGLSESGIQVYRHKFGLDRPFLVQYAYWLKQSLRGDLGLRTFNFSPVTDAILARLGPTVILVSFALVSAIIVGPLIGFITALYQYSLFDYVMTIIAYFSISIPEFFSGFLLIYVFSLRLGLLPTGGMVTAGSSINPLDVLRHLVLPGATLSTFFTAQLIRYSRSSLLEVLGKDYVQTAFSKGLSTYTVIRRHVIRNALSSIVTIISLRIPMLIGGAVVVETVFEWPGMGKLLRNAIDVRDYPLIMGMCLMISVGVVTSMLLADIIYAFLDPRIRYT